MHISCSPKVLFTLCLSPLGTSSKVSVHGSIMTDEEYWTLASVCQGLGGIYEPWGTCYDGGPGGRGMGSKAACYFCR